MSEILTGPDCGPQRTTGTQSAESKFTELLQDFAVAVSWQDDEKEGAAREALIRYFSEGSSKWIPVSERLPTTPTGQYLAASSTGAVETLYYIHGAGWRDDGPQDGYWDQFITHWMPLPEAPK